MAIQNISVPYIILPFRILYYFHSVKYTPPVPYAYGHTVRVWYTKLYHTRVSGTEHTYVIGYPRYCFAPAFYTVVTLSVAGRKFPLLQIKIFVVTEFLLCRTRRISIIKVRKCDGNAILLATYRLSSEGSTSSIYK